MINIIITGAKGRMGKTLLRLIANDPDFKLTGAVDVSDNLGDVISKCDVVVDFSSADATAGLLQTAKTAGKALIIGTTGHDEKQKTLIKEASKKIPLLLSPNMSVGVNLLLKLSELAAKTTGKDYKVSIVEKHHIHKKDAPSGTASRLAELIASSGDIRENIPIESIREGEAVGEHTISFASKGDRIELSHCAFTREIFARGALRAAKWIVDKPAGLYDMQDVLF